MARPGLRLTTRGGLALAVALLLLVPPEAQAGPYGPAPGGGPDGETVTLLLLIGDLVLPDIYLEIEGDSGDLSGDFGWTLPLRLAELELGDIVMLVATASPEVHVNTDCGDVRGVFVGRLSVLPTLPGTGGGRAGVFGEGGYVVGTDGDAPMAGVGIELEFPGLDASFMLKYRVALVDDGPHHAVGLAMVEFPLPVYALYQDGDGDDALVLDLF